LAGLEASARDIIGRVPANPDVQNVGDSIRSGALRVSARYLLSLFFWRRGRVEDGGRRRGAARRGRHTSGCTRRPTWGCRVGAYGGALSRTRGVSASSSCGCGRGGGATLLRALA
ncbi:hypothetical protein B0H19DRAFT_973940, partial [Mycena capillaripes]